MKYILTLTAAVAVAHTSTAAYFADQVISYTPGTGAGSLSNTQAALGAPSSIVGAGSGFDSVFSPFSPHYEASDLVAIGAGGQLTLRLSHFVTIDRTPGVFEIGVWENVSLIDIDYPNGKTGAQAGAFGADSAVVEVSQDGTNWFSLNGGAPILFTLPGTYYTNAGPFDPAVPASPQLADFGKPFTGALSDFDNKTYSEILTVLNGSAGGTWLNLDSAPLAVTQVGFVRFSGVAAGENLEIDAVAINTNLAGSAVPEPGAGVLAMMGVGMIGALRRKRA